MTRTFLDSGVLLTAWRGKECCEQALAVMEDKNREFCTAQLKVISLHSLKTPPGQPTA